METNSVYKAVRRSNFSTLLFSAIALIVLGIVGALSTIPFFVALVTQPHDLAQIEVLRTDLNTLEGQYWVTVSGDDYIDTGYSYSDDEFLEGGSRHYGALLINNRYLIVEQIGTIDEGDREQVGHLLLLTSEIKREVVQDVIRQVDDLTEQDFLPIMLVTYHRQWYVGGAVWLLLTLLALFFFARTIQRYISPLRHPIMADLKAYGEPENVLSEVASDINVNGTALGTLQFGRKWMLYNPKGDFRPVRYNDLMWAHKYTMTNKHYGITVSKQHYMQVYDRYGKMRQFKAKEPQVEAWLEEVRRRSPGTVVGWSEELVTYWDKQRDQFIRDVDTRRTTATAT